MMNKPTWAHKQAGCSGSNFHAERLQVPQVIGSDREAEKQLVECHP